MYLSKSSEVIKICYLGGSKLAPQTASQQSKEGLVLHCFVYVLFIIIKRNLLFLSYNLNRAIIYFPRQAAANGCPLHAPLSVNG